MCHKTNPKQKQSSKTKASLSDSLVSYQDILWLGFTLYSGAVGVFLLIQQARLDWKCHERKVIGVHMWMRLEWDYLNFTKNVIRILEVLWISSFLQLLDVNDSLYTRQLSDGTNVLILIVTIS